MKIVVPNKFVRTGKGKVFFLAGPVLGGGDWQAEAVQILNAGGYLKPRDTVAIPYFDRKGRSFPLYEANKWVGQAGHFGNQLDWERHYIQESGNKGCLIFWLPEESTEDPRPGGGYAQDTRGELARFSVWRGVSPEFRVVVGAQKGFPGLSTLERNWVHDEKVFQGKGIACTSKQDSFYPTLEATLRAAMDLVGRHYDGLPM